MTATAQHHAGSLSPPAANAVAAAVADGLRRAPVVPVAVALTAGILLDRHASLPPVASLIACAASLAAWAACRYGGAVGLARIYLALAVAAFGAGYDRLVAVKTKYDAQNLFRSNQNIKPATTCSG